MGSYKEVCGSIMNIVMLSKHDYAGSGWQIVQAVRRHTERRDEGQDNRTGRQEYQGA